MLDFLFENIYSIIGFQVFIIVTIVVIRYYRINLCSRPFRFNRHYDSNEISNRNQVDEYQPNTEEHSIVQRL